MIKMVNVLKKELAMRFDEAIEHVEKTLKNNGFSILLTKNIGDILKKNFGETKYPKYTTILACGAELAKWV